MYFCVSLVYMYFVLIRIVKIFCVIIMNFLLMLLSLFYFNELIVVVLFLKIFKC